LHAGLPILHEEAQVTLMLLTGASTRECKVKINIEEFTSNPSNLILLNKESNASASCKSCLEVVGKHVIKYRNSFFI
jgi:hypothetical protein